MTPVADDLASLPYRWAVADGFAPDTSTGGFESHESLCALNPGDVPASLVFTAYFADREPSRGAIVTLPARRAVHYRTSDSGALGGVVINAGIPYALELRSDVLLDVQYSRLDTTAPAYTLMTTAVAAASVAASINDTTAKPR